MVIFQEAPLFLEASLILVFLIQSSRLAELYLKIGTVSFYFTPAVFRIVMKGIKAMDEKKK